MINCFLFDQSLHTREAGIFTDTEVDNGYCFITDKVKSYFVTPTSLKDERAVRLDIGGGVVSTYLMQLAYDTEFNSETVDLDALSTDETEELFNIIEALGHRNDLDDTAIESLLAGSPATFGDYVAESFARSAAIGTMDLFQDDAVAGVSRNVYNWVSFTTNIGGDDITLKIWLSRDDFLSDYPHTYFTKVLYPGDPALLVNADYSSIISTIADMSADIISNAVTPVAANDHSGLIQFMSAFHPQGGGIPDEVAIGAMYKGAVPSTQATREFIRDDLLALSITTESVWKIVLPDLFVDGRYFLIPAWDHYEALPGITHPHGIIQGDRSQAIMEAVFPTKDPVWLADQYELLVSAGSEFYILGIPDAGNDVTFMSLVAEHPTYQPIDAQNPTFVNLTPVTQAFNISLSNAIAVLLGGSNEEVFTVDTIDGREYLTFINNLREYHVLKPSSYPGTI